MPILSPASFGSAISNAVNGLSLSTPSQVYSSIDSTYGPVFSSLTMPYHNYASFAGTYNTDCWVNRVLFWKGNELSKVNWYNEEPLYGDDLGGGSFWGNAIPITRRHVLVSEHGNVPTGEYEGRTKLGWLNNANGPFIIGMNNSCRKGVGNVQQWYPSLSETNGWTQGYRVIWMTSDIPVDLVMPIIHRDDMPDLTGRPVIAINRYHEAVIFEVQRDMRDLEGNIENYKLVLKRPTNTSLPGLSNMQKLWRTSTGSTGNDGGDSGSPVFTTFTNVGGQTRLVYIGHITNWGGGSPSTDSTYVCVNWYMHWLAVMEACNELSAENGFGGRSAPQPIYISNDKFSYGGYRQPGPGALLADPAYASGTIAAIA